MMALGALADYGPNRAGDGFWDRPENVRQLRAAVDNTIRRNHALEQLKAGQQISQTCGLKSVGLDFEQAQADMEDAERQDNLHQQMAKLQLMMGQDVDEKGQDRVVATYHKLSDIDPGSHKMAKPAFGLPLGSTHAPQHGVGWGT